MGFHHSWYSKMIKVTWFLRKADHLTLAEFREWWLNWHAPRVRRTQAPYLKALRVSVRIDDDGVFASAPTAEQFPWDGYAEQFFDTVEDFNAVFSSNERPTRAEVLAHTSAIQRMVVEETEIRLD